MIRPNDLVFNFIQIASAETATAVNASFYYDYQNGKPIGDTPAGIKLEVLLPNQRFEKVTVKLLGVKHPITPESFEVAGTTFKVKFSPDFQGKFYKSANGDYMLTCKSTSVEIVR